MGSLNKGEYHVYSDPVCLYSSNDKSKHSKIVGWAFDGNPIYGPYAYSDPLNANSSLKKMTSSYKLRNTTVRTTSSNGTLLSNIYFGPNVSFTYQLGVFQQDYEYINNLGDLGFFLFFFNTLYIYV